MYLHNAINYAGRNPAVTNNELHQERINEVLFRFLQSVYLFEKRESTLFSVSWDEVYLLQLLARQNTQTVTELAEKLKVKSFTVSRMLTRLAAQNLVHRESSAKDRRVVEVSITAQGRKKLRDIETFNYNTILSNLGALKENEVLALMNSIEKLDILLGLNK